MEDGAKTAILDRLHATSGLAAALFPNDGQISHPQDASCNVKGSALNNDSHCLLEGATLRDVLTPANVGTGLGILTPRRSRKLKRAAKFHNEVVTGTFVTLCGRKNRRIFALLHEHSIECFKSPARKQPLNIVLPLSKHGYAPIVLGQCNPDRRTVSLHLSESPEAHNAVESLGKAVSVNFPVVLQFGTNRIFERWFAELCRRLRIAFEDAAPDFRAPASFAKKQKADTVLSKLVFWYYRDADSAKATGPCKASHLLSKFPDPSPHIFVAPAFNYNDFRSNSLWFKSISRWKQSLHDMSRGNSQNHASRVASGAGSVFNATKAALRERLARDGILHVGWGNALSVSCLKRIFGFLAPPDLFQVAYMFVKCSRNVSPNHSQDSISTCGALWASVAFASLFLRLVFPLEEAGAFARRQIERNIVGIARRISIVRASPLLRQEASLSSSGTESLFAGHIVENSEFTDQHAGANQLLERIGVCGYNERSLASPEVPPTQLIKRQKSIQNLSEIDETSEYDFTLRRWSDWAELEHDFGSAAMQRCQRIALQWPSLWVDAYFALDSVRKIYDCRSMRSPSALFMVSVKIPWIETSDTHSEDNVVTLGISTINLSVRDLAKRINAAITVHPYLSQFHDQGMLESINVDVDGGGHHIVKVCGVAEYLTHIDRPIVAFQSVFDPLMKFCGNSNSYNGNFLIPRLEIVTLSVEESEDLAWLCANRDVYQRAIAATLDEKCCTSSHDTTHKADLTREMFRSRAIPTWLVLGPTGSNRSPLQSPQGPLSTFSPSIDAGGILSSDDELPSTESDDDSGRLSLEHPGIAIPRRGRTKVRVHDLDEHFSLHLGSFEVSVEVDVLLGENNISMQFARKTRHSLKVVDILPKELVLILCLEHNNVPLRRQDSRRKDNPLAIALSLEFVEVENNFSEAVFALDVGDRVKNPQLFFDIPVAALPSETDVAGYFTLSKNVDLQDYAGPRDHSFMSFRMPLFDHANRLVTLRELHFPLYMCLNKTNVKKKTKRMLAYKSGPSSADDTPQGTPTMQYRQKASNNSSHSSLRLSLLEEGANRRSMRVLSTPFQSPNHASRLNSSKSWDNLEEIYDATDDDIEFAARSRAPTSGSAGSRSNHRWSLQSSVSFDAGHEPVLTQEPIGDGAIMICLGRIESRETFSSTTSSNTQSSALATNPDQYATIVNTPVHLGECVLFSLACPEAPHSASGVDCKQQLEYCLAMAKLVKEHPVEFQRLHRHRHSFLEGVKMHSGQATTVWEYARHAWRCRDMFLEFVRHSNIFVDTLDEIRHDANTKQSKLHGKDSIKKIAHKVARKLSISSAVRKFGHFEEGSKKERAAAQENSLWDLLPVFATFVSFTDSTEVCSLWRVYSGIVLSYLDGTVSAEHRYAHEMYSSSSRQHRHQQSHTKVSSDDVGIDIPNQSVCCQHTREVAEDFLGYDYFAGPGLTPANVAGNHNSSNESSTRPRRRRSGSAPSPRDIELPAVQHKVEVPVHVVLALLDQCPSDSVTRKFCVFCLSTMSDFRILSILPQLIQSLKSERRLDNALARFILRRAISDPANIGHRLFWLLRTEIDGPHQIQADAQFRAMLWFYITYAKPHVKYLEEQTSLTDILMSVGDIMRLLKKTKLGIDPSVPGSHDLASLGVFEIQSFEDEDEEGEASAKHQRRSIRHQDSDLRGDKARKKAAKERRVQFLRCLLRLAGVALPSAAAGPFTLPLNHHRQVQRIIAGESRVMSSKQAPLWVSFENADGASEKNVIVLCKQGDDLRQDDLTLQALRHMQYLWWGHGINLKLHVYDVMSTGFMSGLVEIVPSSTIGALHATAGGTSTDGTVVKHLKKITAAHAQGLSITEMADGVKKKRKKNLLQVTTIDDYMLDNFVRSCAGYCAATYCMGIGDRHPSNVMVTETGHLFHIDFGHFLGNWKTKMGVKREVTKVTFYASLMKVITDHHLKDTFHRMCARAFQILRMHSGLLHQLFVGCIPAQMPELTDVEDAQYLADHLHVKSDDHSAHKLLQEEINKAVADVMRKIDNMFHHYVHYRKK